MPKAPNPDSKTKTRLTPLSQEAVEYGTGIRQAREKRRFSERDLCDEVGFSQTKLNKLENGRAYLTLEDLMKIAKALDMRPDEIVKDLALVNQITQTHNSSPVANVAREVVYHKVDFETEREVWKELDKARQDVIVAKNQALEAQVATNTAQQETIQALKLALGNKIGTVP